MYVYTHKLGILVGDNSMLRPRRVLDEFQDVLLARSWQKKLLEMKR